MCKCDSTEREIEMGGGKELAIPAHHDYGPRLASSLLGSFLTGTPRHNYVHRTSFHYPQITFEKTISCDSLALFEGILLKIF